MRLNTETGFPPRKSNLYSLMNLYGIRLDFQKLDISFVNTLLIINNILLIIIIPSIKAIFILNS